jgi:phosphoenolpyruvate carboxykinase (ATP)
VNGVDRNLLNPALNWTDQKALAENSIILMQQFIDNFKKFDVSDEIRQAGPIIG